MVVHGTGHNAGAIHSISGDNGERGFMLDGQTVTDLMSGKPVTKSGTDYQPVTGFKDFFDSTLFPGIYNQRIGTYGFGPVPAIVRTFGNSKPVDNYHKRKKQ